MHSSDSVLINWLYSLCVFAVTDVESILVVKLE